jgi:hypothetical protein
MPIADGRKSLRDSLQSFPNPSLSRTKPHLGTKLELLRGEAKALIEPKEADEAVESKGHGF